MRKVSATLLAAAFLAAPLTIAAPVAHAGDNKVEICHATSAANGHYTLNRVDKDSIAGGHAGAGHQEGRDIIPAFSWVDENRVRQYFPGQNTDKLDILSQGCKVAPQNTPASPNAPTYVPASCSRPDLPYGEVVIPKHLGVGVAGASSAMNPSDWDLGVSAQGGPAWSVSYALEPSHVWPEGFNGNYSFPVVPLSADPDYVTDSQTGVGQCELPETGIEEYRFHILFGLLALGAGIAIRRFGIPKV